MFLFSEDWFGDDVSVGCKHRRSSSVFDGDLFHEARVFDGLVLLLGSTVAVCVSVVPLGAHSVPEKRDKFPSPYSSRVVFSIRLLVVWKADKEGFLELAPFVNKASLEELGPADFRVAVFEVAVQSF